MKYVVFDFNGTILDDVKVGMEAENRTIRHFGLQREPLTLDEYTHIFTFPVKDYYEKVGFDWNRFDYKEVGQYWFDCYCSLKSEYRLYDGVIELLEENRRKGISNVVLSASSLKALKIQLDELGIADYFDEVLGLGDIYAGSKEDIAVNWAKDKDKDECIMLGDTLHDLDVANAMGIRCILIARGHQAKDLLLEKTDNVVDDIREVKI